MLAISLLLFLIISVAFSSVGLGGGAFYVPLFLLLGHAFPVASSTSLFLIMVTGLSAFTRFQKEQMVDWKLAVVMDTFTDIGAFAGGYTAFRFATGYLETAFGVLLIMASYFIFKMQRRGEERPEPRKGFGYWQREFSGHRYSISVPVVVPVTFAIGYASGALGIAGGLLKIPIMILWFKVPAKVAVATSSLMVGLTGLLGFGGHILTGEVDWVLALTIGAAVMMGGQIGSRISIGLPEKKLKLMIAIIFLIVAIWMIIRSGVQIA